MRSDDVSSEKESRSALLSSFIFEDLVLGSSALTFVLDTSPRNVGLQALEFILSLVLSMESQDKSAKKLR